MQLTDREEKIYADGIALSRRQMEVEYTALRAHVMELLNDCDAYSLALELYNVDGEKWCDRAKEILNMEKSE